MNLAMGCLQLPYDYQEEPLEKLPSVLWEVHSKKGSESKKGVEYYRYGFQGEYAEEDSETGWNSFELRMYDPVIGRWSVTDPAGQYFSPYLSFGNNPIMRVDPDGGFDWFANKKTGEVVHAEGKGADYASELGQDFAWVAKDGDISLFYFNSSASMRLDGGTLIRSWDAAQSSLLMKANNYNLVPTIAFEFRSSISMMISGGSVTNTTITSVYENMTYVPSGYFSKEYIEFSRANSPLSATYLKTFSYSKQDPNKHAINSSFKILSFTQKLINVFKGSGGASHDTIRKVRYVGWDDYPSDGILNDYRPGGIYRPN
ncbi:MAG: RHS repeat-associated core domain-containing protein [Bacteroidota bacterium]